MKITDAVSNGPIEVGSTLKLFLAAGIYDAEVTQVEEGGIMIPHPQNGRMVRTQPGVVFKIMGMATSPSGRLTEVFLYHPMQPPKSMIEEVTQ
jgi:hypothetical protein